MAKAPKQAAEEETMDVAPKKGKKKAFHYHRSGDATWQS